MSERASAAALRPERLGLAWWGRDADPLPLFGRGGGLGDADPGQQPL